MPGVTSRNAMRRRSTAAQNHPTSQRDERAVLQEIGDRALRGWHSIGKVCSHSGSSTPRRMWLHKGSILIMFLSILLSAPLKAVSCFVFLGASKVGARNSEKTECRVTRCMSEGWVCLLSLSGCWVFCIAVLYYLGTDLCTAGTSVVLSCTRTVCMALLYLKVFTYGCMAHFKGSLLLFDVNYTWSAMVAVPPVMY